MVHRLNRPNIAPYLPSPFEAICQSQWCAPRACKLIYASIVMQVPLTPAPSASAAVERIRKCLDETLIHLDNPDADLGSSPLISLDITASHTTGGNTTLESAETLLRDLDDVSQLLVNLALRYNEQVALLKTNHTSTVLKHQVESRRLNDRIAQDAKVASATSEALQNAKAENGLLQEQLRQEQLTSGAKIDVLHQKIVQLESTLHTAQQKLQQHQLSTVPTPASASPSPSENAPQTSDTPSLVASSDSATLSTGAESEKEATSLERYEHNFQRAPFGPTQHGR